MQVAEKAIATAKMAMPLWQLALEAGCRHQTVAPDDWRGVQAREQVVKAALYSILKNSDEVERIFKIIFQQHEY
jgi:type I restriction enzyme, R subunit